MIELDNQTDFKVDVEELESISNRLTNRDIELIIVNNSHIQEINREFRDKDNPTDVLSFPIEGIGDILPLGSIIISIDFVIEKAKEYGHANREELLLLFIHGLLHLLGYDHEIDNGEMREKEEEIIRGFSLSSSLIVRSS